MTVAVENTLEGGAVFRLSCIIADRHPFDTVQIDVRGELVVGFRVCTGRVAVNGGRKTFQIISIGKQIGRFRRSFTGKEDGKQRCGSTVICLRMIGERRRLFTRSKSKFREGFGKLKRRIAEKSGIVSDKRRRSRSADVSTSKSKESA